MANNFMSKMMGKAATQALVAMGAGFASFAGKALVKGGLNLLTKSKDADVEYVTDDDLTEEICEETTEDGDIVLAEEED